MVSLWCMILEPCGSSRSARALGTCSVDRAGDCSRVNSACARARVAQTEKAAIRNMAAAHFCLVMTTPAVRRALKGKGAHKGAARVCSCPCRAESLALECLFQSKGRHRMRSLDERRVVEFLVTADVVAFAQAARTHANEVAGHKADTAVVIASADAQLDGSGFHSHDVGHQLARFGSHQGFESMAFHCVRALVDDQHRLRRVRTVIGVAKRGASLHYSQDAEPV